MERAELVEETIREANLKTASLSQGMFDYYRIEAAKVFLEFGFPNMAQAVKARQILAASRFDLLSLREEVPEMAMFFMEWADICRRYEI